MTLSFHESNRNELLNGKALDFMITDSLTVQIDKNFEILNGVYSWSK